MPIKGRLALLIRTFEKFLDLRHIVVMSFFEIEGTGNTSGVVFYHKSQDSQYAGKKR